MSSPRRFVADPATRTPSDRPEHTGSSAVLRPLASRTRLGAEAASSAPLYERGSHRTAAHATLRSGAAGDEAAITSSRERPLCGSHGFPRVCIDWGSDAMRWGRGATADMRNGITCMLGSSADLARRVREHEGRHWSWRGVTPLK